MVVSAKACPAGVMLLQFEDCHRRIMSLQDTYCPVSENEERNFSQLFSLDFFSTEMRLSHIFSSIFLFIGFTIFSNTLKHIMYRILNEKAQMNFHSKKTSETSTCPPHSKIFARKNKAQLSHKWLSTLAKLVRT